MLKDTIPAAFILAEVLKLWEQRMLMPFHKKKKFVWSFLHNFLKNDPKYMRQYLVITHLESTYG